MKTNDFLKVKSMQRLGTQAVRIQIKPSKPKREIKTKLPTLNGQL